MPLTNIKCRESVPAQGIAKLKRHKQKTVYSMRWASKCCFTMHNKFHRSYFPKHLEYINICVFIATSTL